MSRKSRYLDTVLKLNRLTQDGKIEWECRDARRHEGIADVASVPEGYATEQKGKRFALYQAPVGEEKSRRERFADAMRVESRSFVRAALEIRDASGNPLFEFPRMSAANDLHEAVHTRRSNEVDAFLDEFPSET